MPGQAIVTINESQWTVSLATTYAELTTGLSGVASLSAGTGMLFILPATQAVSVDTTGMNFALDIVFIANNVVIDVARNIQPGYLVTEETNCDSFLEVNAGEAVDVEAGDAVDVEPLYTIVGDDIGAILSFAVPLAALGFVCAMAGGMVKLIGGSSSSPRQLSPGTNPEEKKLWYLGEWWEEEYSTAECVVYRSADGKKRLYVYWDGTKEVKPVREEYHSPRLMQKNQPPLGITPKEQEFAEFMWQSTKELVEEGDISGTIIWGILEHHYPGNKEKQTRLLGFMNEFLTEQKKRHPKGVPSDVLWELAGKWDVERAIVTETLRAFPGVQGWASSSSSGTRELPPKHPTEKVTVKCPICEKEIEVVGYRVTRSEALRKHVEEEHSRGGEHGTCYEDAWRFLLKEQEGELIHGSVLTIGKRINHAWVELPTSFIWEPESGEFMKKSYFYERAEPRVQDRYTVEEAAIMAARAGNLGPWTEEERRQILSGHHSMWLTLEQRKELEKKYGAVAVRWAEEATRPGDLKGVETAAEYYSKKMREIFGLGHLSPELSEEQLKKLRELLGLDAAEVLKIHQETGYIPC